MTPGAQVEAAIELVAAIGEGRAAADDVVGEWFRRHRFAGVKDRGAISGHVYAVLRHRASIDWWIERVGGAVPSPRPRVLAALALVEGWSLDAIDRACDGDRFRPPPLSPGERRLLEGLDGRSLAHPEMPPEARDNHPAWLRPHLEAALGAALGEEMAALNGNAPLDLRVNLLKAEGRRSVREALAGGGVKAQPTPLSPLGLRVLERIPLATLRVFKEGLVEVQDEGSQVAALLADARPGMRVVDFCAGAGGKTLALAAQMRNQGHLVACDVSERRLERATQRLRRAGAGIVRRQPLSGARDKWVKRHKGGFDRVFVDAPCTGTGTWRRNPDAKWRLRPQDLEELVALQAEILDSAERLVKPGGRLVYATCSLLLEEDERQVERFLAAHPDFRLLPVPEVWAEAIGKAAPAAAPMLRLTPARNGTDGFFVAVMARAPTPEPDQAEKVEDDADDSRPRLRGRAGRGKAAARSARGRQSDGASPHPDPPPQAGEGEDEP
jgi:16S rRNA (cytosine967-C5)-methyltransferase